jgi:hypothetical protein
MKKTVVLVLGILLVVVLSSGCIQTGTGSSTDTIYGIEMNGFLWKTYSIWLTHDNPSGIGKNSYSAVYTVNNNDKQLIKQIEDAYNSKQEVKLYYRNEMFYEPWTYAGDAVAEIYKIEYVNTTSS